ncbi:Fis family transcriptional regulator [Streptomyces sioyaensis]|uniref:pPIWI_RE_Y domain-containing protein n=1 Tax=Streptomyces sioyaensis TaxID=67364 RepID=UPI003D711D9F
MPPTANWEVNQDVALLHTLANAIVALEDAPELESFRLPYPAEAQRALDRTALACLRRGAEPPRSIPQLLDWCRTRPLASWPLDLPPDAIGPNDQLLDEETGLPTELVREWWVHRRDSLARLHDREVVRWALRKCKEAGLPESYTAFRRLLVERPVLTHTEWFPVVSDPLLLPLQELLGGIYQDVPASYLRPERGCAVCLRCGTLLTPVGEADWWCERDFCRSLGTVPPIGRIIEPEDFPGLVHLDRPLRQFVTWPGRAELALEKGLVQHGLTVEMWPGFDAYDLRVTFPHGRVWAVDVKDWAHPGLLGRSAKPVRPEPPYHEAFWVVPEHRADARPDYLDIFHRNRPTEAQNLPLLTDNALLRRARQQMKQTKTGSGEDGMAGDAHA